MEKKNIKQTQGTINDLCLFSLMVSLESFWE